MTHDQDLGRRLGETLHRRADALHDTPLDLLDVRSRATSIRRRRAAVAGVAVAAAVAAVVVPLSLLPIGGDDRGLDLQPAETITPITEPVPLDPRSAPEGAAPRVPYTVLDAKQLITPAGTYDLPEAYPQIIPFADGWQALSTKAPGVTGTRVVRLDSDFREVDGSAQTTDMAVREDGGHSSYVQYDGAGTWTLVSAPTDGSEDYSSVLVSDGGERALTRAVGYVSDDSVVVATTDQNSADTTFEVVGPDRRLTEFDGFLSLDSSSSVSGLVAGQTQYLGDGSCSGVLDPFAADPELEWETCDHALGAFSPDGTYVVGLAPYYDGLGSPSVGILDAATGEPVVDFVAGNDPGSAAAVNDVVWEDATTLLATVTQGNEQYVVRATIDGRVERVAGPAPSEMSVEYRFAAHPFG